MSWPPEGVLPKRGGVHDEGGGGLLMDFRGAWRCLEALRDF